MKKLYKSYRESFSKDIYMPFCGVVAAPTVVLELSSEDKLDLLSSEMPPQNVIININESLYAINSLGECIDSLYSVLALCKRSIPIICFDSEKAAEALPVFLDENHAADVIICTSYENRELLKAAYARFSLVRCMLDCRGVNVPVDELPAIAVSHEATSVIVDTSYATEYNIASLNQRFIHVICDSENGFASSAAAGANGIITNDLTSAYAFLNSFPENSFFRKHKLFAHKGFQNNGAYTENTITSVVAAAEHYFDGAEIDVKLTSDDIPVVMHNVNTKGLFDIEPAITEESDYAFLSSLRRIGFPNESIDCFLDLMIAMKDHKNTPVLIEFKPSAKYYKLEELVRQTDEFLKRADTQKNCIGIVGVLEPGLRYVHERIPYLPLSHCEGGKATPPPPETRRECEDRLYRVALITNGCAAGYNCEDVCINRLFNEYAKFRMLTVFPWSRSWTLSPSKWEENGMFNDKTYLSGYDAWTTDHGEKYLDKPIAIELPDSMDIADPIAYLVYRDGHKEEAVCRVHNLPNGKAMLYREIELHFGDSYKIYSSPFNIK